MQAEQELKRNFCYKCNLKIADNSSYCPKCFNTDLIPEPNKILEESKNLNNKWIQDWKSKNDIKRNVEDDNVDFLLEEPKSKLVLDENAVHKILNDLFGFLTGLAGTGKTTLINEINRLYPNELEVCATTGIAAVNLNTKTINSTLKYYDTNSLSIAHMEQKLHMNLRKIRAHKKKLLIDEASMMDAEQLNIIINAVDDINGDNTGKHLGVWLTGDLCQLPPVKAKYIFHSDYWDRFERNAVKLTKIWRQSDAEFLNGINLVRQGKGLEAMEVFKSCGVHFESRVNDNFQGTTLIPKNDGVDDYNLKRLNQLTTPLIRTTIKKLGKQLTEWTKSIPFELRLKKGAYVMILSNDIPDFEYVNGDTGFVEDYNVKENTFKIKLVRNNQIVTIGQVKRENMVDREPYPNETTTNFTPYNDFKSSNWCVGTIHYHPLRLAYANTIHKSQGLSLDRVQIDTSHQFFGEPSMGYVSISRARTPDGLYLVGNSTNIGRKIRMSPEVARYI